MVENKLAKVAIETARKAGTLLMEYYENLTPDKIFDKGVNDLVTEGDRASEKLIAEEIDKIYPDHNLHGEEFLNKQGDSPYTWVIDPLDGTTNFAHGHPSFVVSIAVIKEQIVEAGAVYAPYMNEMFYAAIGEGAYLNDKRISVSPISDLSRSLLATGFPYQRHQTPYNNIDNFNWLLMKSQGVRRCGAAALDLCYVANGRYEGFWEMWLHAHDVAAGSLIIQEAGGKVSDWYGKEDYLYGKNIVASNGHIHHLILQNLVVPDKEVWKSGVV